MRVGEVLNLERDCVTHDPATGLWSITGRHWKDAIDHHGDKIPKANGGATRGPPSSRPPARSTSCNGSTVTGC